MGFGVSLTVVVADRLAFSEVLINFCDRLVKYSRNLMDRIASLPYLVVHALGQE